MHSVVYGNFIVFSEGNLLRDSSNQISNRNILNIWSNIWFVSFKFPLSLIENPKKKLVKCIANSPGCSSTQTTCLVLQTTRSPIY